MIDWNTYFFQIFLSKKLKKNLSECRFFLIMLIFDFFRMRTYISHETWLRRKQEEATMLRQKQEHLAAARPRSSLVMSAGSMMRAG